MLFDTSWLRASPEIVAWLIGIVLAIVMVRRGGHRAEKLLLAGCSLMLAARLISLLLTNVMPWIREQAMSAAEFGLALSLLAGVPALAGIICLGLVFWLRFRPKRWETA